MKIRQSERDYNRFLKILIKHPDQQLRIMEQLRILKIHLPRNYIEYKVFDGCVFMLQFFLRIKRFIFTL